MARPAGRAALIAGGFQIPERSATPPAMNRTGLFIALSVGALSALIFGLFPKLDLQLAALFYDASTSAFGLKANRIAAIARDAAMWIAWAFAAPAIVALLLKLIRPRRKLLISARAVAFILLTIFLSAGLVTNLIFKSHWGRPRPVATTEFGGHLTFAPWWDPRGKCQRNCSFISGEAATAFWTYAPAALAPPQYRVAAYAGATVFGLATGALRMAFGGHYATDVIFAGVVVFLIVWLVHGMIYRWPRAPLSDDERDQRFGAAVLALRDELAGRAGAANPKS
jgi:membrane-associated PAP2 superfamily phosphatase